MLKFIHDETELHRFFDLILPPLNDKEVYFTSLSARNKQLTEEERTYYSLGRTEMFERKIIREKDWVKFSRTIRKYETDEKAVLGRTGIPLPLHCLILYVNINPCDCVKAYGLFTNGVNQNISNILLGSKTEVGYFKKLDREWMNAIQKAHGIKHYVDIDIDILPETTQNHREYLLTIVCFALKDKGIKYFVVNTKGGYHILMRKNSIKFNYNEMIADWHDEFTDSGIAKEIKSND